MQQMTKICFYILLFLSLKAIAQDPKLLSNDWYFHYGTLNGEDFFLPYPTFEARLGFSEDSFSISHPQCEEVLGDDINYDSNDIFNLSGDIFILLGSCDPEGFIYNKHYPIYYTNDIIPINPFTYIIETEGTNSTLTIENNVGDIAIYGNHFLGIANFNEPITLLYPNPAYDQISLSSTKVISNVLVYDILGVKLKSQVDINDEVLNLDISDLSPGLYLIKVKIDKKNIVKRFIKQ